MKVPLQQKRISIRQESRKLMTLGIMFILLIPIWFLMRLFHPEVNPEEMEEQKLVLRTEPDFKTASGRFPGKHCLFFVENYSATFSSPELSNSLAFTIEKEIHRGDIITAKINRKSFDLYGEVPEEIKIESLYFKNKTYYTFEEIEEQNRESFKNSVFVSFTIGIVLILIGLLFLNWN